MAILKNPQTDGASGHIGEVIYFSRYGKQLTRRFPKKYHDLNSDAQQDIRYAKFKPLMEYSRKVKFYVKMIYQTQPRGKSAFSFFMHQCKDVFGGTVNSPTVDFTQALVGSGDLPQCFATAITPGLHSAFTITWDPAAVGPYPQPTDLCLVVINMADGSEVILKNTGVARSVGTATVSIPGSFTGVQIVVSDPFFMSVDGKMKGPTQLGSALGAITVPL